VLRIKGVIPVYRIQYPGDVAWGIGHRAKSNSICFINSMLHAPCSMLYALLYKNGGPGTTE
jgi:hypothetical protein